MHRHHAQAVADVVAASVAAVLDIDRRLTVIETRLGIPTPARSAPTDPKSPGALRLVRRHDVGEP